MTFWGARDHRDQQKWTFKGRYLGSKTFEAQIGMHYDEFLKIFGIRLDKIELNEKLMLINLILDTLKIVIETAEEEG